MSTRCKACDAQVQLRYDAESDTYEELCGKCLAVVADCLRDMTGDGEWVKPDADE